MISNRVMHWHHGFFVLKGVLIHKHWGIFRPHWIRGIPKRSNIVLCQKLVTPLNFSLKTTTSASMLHFGLFSSKIGPFFDPKLIPRVPPKS